MPLSAGKAARYAAPTPISVHDEFAGFESGRPVLDEWLKKRALANEGQTSRTYVVTTETEKRVVGYYTLATTSVTRNDLPGRLRRSAPDPVPAMLLARLAVDRRHQAAGIGRAMLREAMARTVEVSTVAGVRMLVVHAIDDSAVQSYARFGFLPLPGIEAAMCLPIETMRFSL